MTTTQLHVLPTHSMQWYLRLCYRHCPPTAR